MGDRRGSRTYDAGDRACAAGREPEQARWRGRGRAGRVRAWVLLGALVLTSALGPGGATGATASPAAADGPTRVLLVGDSVTHASVGDYSWRYFAWQHLVRSRASVDFVGPSRTPYVDPGSPWPATYADARFDQDHAATWGDRMAINPLHDRVGLMDRFRPDVVVVELGTNDLGPFGGLSAEQTAAGARDWVVRARGIVPGVDLVLVEVPVAASAAVREYNQLLGELADELDTPASRVVVARVASDFVAGADDDRVSDTYDGLHPNTRGQVKLAAAVTDALARLGVGRAYPRPLAFPAEGPRGVPRLRARTADTWALLSWSMPPGATSTDVWMRRSGREWRRVVRAHPSSTVGVRSLRACVRYDFRVRARKGWTPAGADVASPVIRAVAGPSVAGTRPRVSVRPRRGAVAVRWSAVRSACRHRLEVRYRAASGKQVVRARAVAGRSARVQVPPGVKVRVRVRASGARDEGRWSVPRKVRVLRR